MKPDFSKLTHSSCLSGENCWVANEKKQKKWKKTRREVKNTQNSCYLHLQCSFTTSYPNIRSTKIIPKAGWILIATNTLLLDLLREFHLLWYSIHYFRNLKFVANDSRETSLCLSVTSFHPLTQLSCLLQFLFKIDFVDFKNNSFYFFMELKMNDTSLISNDF